MLVQSTAALFLHFSNDWDRELQMVLKYVSSPFSAGRQAYGRRYFHFETSPGEKILQLP